MHASAPETGLGTRGDLAGGEIGTARGGSSEAGPQQAPRAFKWWDPDARRLAGTRGQRCTLADLGHPFRARRCRMPSSCVSRRQGTGILARYARRWAGAKRCTLYACAPLVTLSARERAARLDPTLVGARSRGSRERGGKRPALCACGPLPLAREQVLHALVPGAEKSGLGTRGSGRLPGGGHLPEAGAVRLPTSVRLSSVHGPDGPLSSVRTFCQPPSRTQLSPPAPQSQARRRRGELF